MFDFASSLYFADLFRYFHMADQLEMTKTFGPPLGNFLLKTNFSIKKIFHGGGFVVGCSWDFCFILSFGINSKQLLFSLPHGCQY